MAGDHTITEWLHNRGKKFLTVELAKELAAESKTGWFITNHGKDSFVIGKFSIVKWSPNHIVSEGDGKPVLFASVQGARIFLSEVLSIQAAHLFDVR
jgi:hypothetical protein